MKFRSRSETAPSIAEHGVTGLGLGFAPDHWRENGQLHNLALESCPNLSRFMVLAWTY